MRAIVVVAGLFGFSMVASAGGELVTAKTPPKFYEADYTFAPGTVYEEIKPFRTSRQFRFVFPNVDTARNKQTGKPEIVLDKNSLLLEYRREDVARAKDAAASEAKKSGGDAKAILAKKLSLLPVKQVDCRMVARKMVEHVIGHRVESDKSASSVDGESHRMQTRADALDVALAAKQLDTITITTDTTLTRNFREGKEFDPDEGLTCTPTTVRTEIRRSEDEPSQWVYQDAACGDLRIAVNPLPARSGPLQGKNAIIVSRETCTQLSAEMDDVACELVAQIQGCGLRYAMKSLTSRSGKPFVCGLQKDQKLPVTAGLSDRLEFAISKDSCDLREGRYTNASAPVVPVAASPEAPAAPTVFDDGFKVPSQPVF